MTQLARNLMPEDWVSEKETLEILGEAFKTVDMEYGIEEANKWAEDFTFPAEVAWRDLVDLGREQWDLNRLAQQRNLILIHDRFSVQRLKALWDPLDPDMEHLLLLAAGVPVWLDRDFVPTLIPPPLSPAYVQVSAVINKLCYEQWKAGQALILPLSTITDPDRTNQARVSLSGKYGWVPKSGAREGRPTNNYSYDNRKQGLINTAFVKQSVKDFYGPIELAQLDELMKMVLRQWEIAEGNWDSVSIWKMDLKGAFALLNFKTDEIGLLAMVLTDNLCFLSLVGNFGLSQYPYVFGIISRVLLRAINKELTGEMRIFVDDFLGACLTANLEGDMAIAKGKAERLLGSRAISTKKTFSGRKLDWIGWEIDLDAQTVSIAHHNLCKTLYGFFTVDYQQKITVKRIQRMASWASRYTVICRFLRPFTYYLYNAIRGRTQMQSLIVVEGTLWMAIQLWQIFLIMSKLRPGTYARQIMTFTTTAPATMWLSYDASLSGIGFILRTVEPQREGNQYEGVVSAVSYDTPYELEGVSGYQNTMEFIAIVLGMFHMRTLGYGNCNVHIIGDNTTSLHWCDKERFRGGRSNGAALAFVIQAMNSGNEITGSTFIPGVSNIHCDRLSRGIRPRSLNYPMEVCHRADLDVNFQTLANLVDPTVTHTDSKSLVALWTAIKYIC